VIKRFLEAPCSHLYYESLIKSNEEINFLELVFVIKVRAPIPSIYYGFYTMNYKDIGEFQILYSQDICW
jgi:hypothetical protein